MMLIEKLYSNLLADNAYDDDPFTNANGRAYLTKANRRLYLSGPPRRSAKTISSTSLQCVIMSWCNSKTPLLFYPVSMKLLNCS